MDLARVCPASNQHQSTPALVRASGVSRHQLARAHQAGVLVRVARGIYSPQALPARGQHLLSGGSVDLGYLAEVRAFTTAYRCVAARRTAAVLWRFDLLVEPTEVEVDVPASRWSSPAEVQAVRRPPRPTVGLRIAGLDPVRATSAVQTVIDCALELPLLEAVVVADSAMRRKTVQLTDLRAAADQLRGTPGAARVRQVLALSDPRSGSVLETAFRVLVMLAGLPRPSSQFVIRNDRAFVARVDFCWEDLRLVVEVDGRQWHDPADRRANDRVRDNTLERLSWRVLRFTWAEVLHDPDAVVELVSSCLRGWMAA